LGDNVDTSDIKVYDRDKKFIMLIERKDVNMIQSIVFCKDAIISLISKKIKI
jgi:hypothetical protein